MQQWYQCPRCGKDVLYGVNPCPYCKCSLAWSQQGPVLYIPPPGELQQPPPQYQHPQQQLGQQYQQPQQTPQYQQPYKAEPPKKKTNVWLMGCLGLIGLAVIIGVIAVATSSGTPTSSPTSSSTITAAERAYAFAIVDQASILSKALTEIGYLSRNYRFGDNEWTTNMALQLSKIRIVHDEAMAMTPPSSMADIHYQYTQGLEHYYTMTELIANGIDELDASLINQAATEMDIGNGYITEATNLMNDFTESKSK